MDPIILYPGTAVRVALLKTRIFYQLPLPVANHLQQSPYPRQSRGFVKTVNRSKRLVVREPPKGDYLSFSNSFIWSSFLSVSSCV